MAAKAPAAPDPLSPENQKKLAIRLGLPTLAVWVICGSIAGFSQSSTMVSVFIAIPAVITVAVAGLLVWVVRQARKAKGVQSILQGIETAEDRAAALEQIESRFKEKDPTAIFAKAQLQMQEDPKQALETLERIDLGKVMPAVADEARTQRAMIHLMQGQVTPARDLVDGIELNRHQEPRTRAMMGAVVAEAWARSGQAKKALDVLDLFEPEDDEYEAIRPQLYRARAFAYAYSSKLPQMKRSLRKLMDHDIRLLGGFMVKKTHPLLQKEAKKLLEKSGQMPRKMTVQRR